MYGLNRETFISYAFSLRTKSPDRPPVRTAPPAMYGLNRETFISYAFFLRTKSPDCPPVRTGQAAIKKSLPDHTAYQGNTRHLFNFTTAPCRFTSLKCADFSPDYLAIIPSCKAGPAVVEFIHQPKRAGPKALVVKYKKEVRSKGNLKSTRFNHQ